MHKANAIMVCRKAVMTQGGRVEITLALRGAEATREPHVEPITLRMPAADAIDRPMVVGAVYDVAVAFVRAECDEHEQPLVINRHGGGDQHECPVP